MGHTFRKEKTFDDYGNGRKHRKSIFQDIERKQTKNKKLPTYYQDNFDEEFEDEVEDDYDDDFDYEIDKNNNNFTKNRK